MEQYLPLVLTTLLRCCWQTSIGHFISRCHGWWNCNSGLFRILLLTNGCWMNQSRSLSWLSKLVPNEASTRGCCVTNHTPLAGLPHTPTSTLPKTTWKWMSFGNGQHWKLSHHDANFVDIGGTAACNGESTCCQLCHHWWYRQQVVVLKTCGVTGDDRVGNVT